MQEDMSRMISSTRRNASAEPSDPSSSSFPFQRNRKLRHNNNGSLPSSKFKGVVPQQNGHWGAQIYANHQRVWLGTFKSEKEAALAYDSAAIKLRSGDSYRNFPWTILSIQEPTFQDNYTTEAVLNMIKDGSYQNKFAEFLKMQAQTQTDDTELSLGPEGRMQLGSEEMGLVSRLLFQRELTTSDVGKLNRLVIPKKYAIKFLPQIEEDEGDGPVAAAVGGSGEGVDTELTFYDKMMRTWKFRYCHWKSSQSFVFTRGWNRFVKEKDLKSKDIVSFYMCEYKGDNANNAMKFCMIDVNKDESNVVQGQGVEQPSMVHIADKSKTSSGTNVKEDEIHEEDMPTEVEEKDSKRNGIRLFGVDISQREGNPFHAPSSPAADIQFVGRGCLLTGFIRQRMEDSVVHSDLGNLAGSKCIDIFKQL